MEVVGLQCRLLAPRSVLRWRLAEQDIDLDALMYLTEAEQKLVYATQGAPVADLFNQKVEGTAWKAKPSWYVLATQDQTVHPDLQRFVAKRMGATTVETDSSHVPMLSQPPLVLDVIRKAATVVQKS